MKTEEQIEAENERWLEENTPKKFCHPLEYARPRLSNQNAKILAMLQTSDCSNMDLTTVTPRYGARIFDLRKLGYTISIIKQDHVTGLVVYRLER